MWRRALLRARRHQPLPLHQLLGRHLRSGIKPYKISYFDDCIFFAETRIAVAQATYKRQALHQAGLAAFECTMDMATCARLLPLCTASRRLTTTGAVSTAYTSFCLVRTGSGSQIREFH